MSQAIHAQCVFVVYSQQKDLTRDQNRIMLPNLEPLVNYCVEVAILYN